MINTSDSIQKLIDHFASLPSIGKKTAQRLVFHLLKKDEMYLQDFANSIINISKNVKLCNHCFNFTDSDPCVICSSNKRKNNIICVVEQASDVLVIERTNEFFGKYHVLHGLLNPIDGITPDVLKIKELLTRLTEVEEVILALNPTIEGEMTIQYLSKFIKPLNIKISRIARGVPIGSSLEFTDQATISNALESRVYI
jgi:recombination protein RecR